MLMVLLVSVSSTTAVRTAIKGQYYQQLARVAGDAGIAYAQACLSANNDIPTWSNANPLMSNTDCTGAQTTACPDTTAALAAAACAVTRNGNVLSNFQVGLPTVDPNGRAVTLPNTGFVQVLRTSNNAVWRTYQQNAAPTTAVPDLCSGTATTALGWANAVAYTPIDTFPTPLSLSIGPSAGSVNPGPIYLRKDFSVSKAGTFTLNVLGDDVAAVSIDGTAVTTANWPTLSTVTTGSLAVGCHDILVKLTNANFLANVAKLTLSLIPTGASNPIVVSDTSWRVSAGNPVHYSTVNYYAAPATWIAVKDEGAYNGSGTWGAGPVPDWAGFSGVAAARWISTVVSYPTYPTGYSQFRDTRVITVATPTEVKVSYACDNTCDVWLDGQKIASATAAWNVDESVTVTLSEGSHKFGLDLYNTVGPAGFLFGAVRLSDGSVLSLSDTNWTTSNLWSAADQNPYSYDNSYTPNPPS